MGRSCGRGSGAERSPDAGRARCLGLIRAKLAPHRLPRGSVSRPELLGELRLGRGRA